jgi:energy-coupling factor transporter ATP-binding protein EcfA2
MKFRALELEQFRKFDRPVRVAGMADGLNLVGGPNEMGKSTLFAALQAVLFERHRSQAQTVKSFQPAAHEGASPRVALDFEIDGARYRIEKRFLRRGGAELALPDGRHLHGEAAEEALEGLLEGGQSGARRGVAEAPGVWSLLWVGQGQSFDLPEVAQGARDTLQTALDAEVGEVLGGGRGAALLATLEEALHELIYRRGQPRGRYREASEELARLRQEIERLARDRGELEHDLAALEDAQADFERLRAGRAAGCEEAELAELTARRDRLEVGRADLREAEADLKAKRVDLEKAESARTRRRALAEDLAKADTELTAATVGASEAEVAAEAAARLAGEQATRVERLQATRDAAENHLRGLQRLAQAIRQRDDGRAALRAAASEVTLELEPEALARVRLGGLPMREPSRSLRIVDPLTIEIEGIGRIAIRPVVADRKRLQSSLKDAEQRIARELKVLGLRPPGPRARQLEFDLAANIWLAGNAAALGSPAADAPPWPEAAAVETALGEAEQQIDGLVAQLRPARRELDQSLEARLRQEAAREQALARREQAGRRLEQLRAELSEAERSGTETDLAARSAELRRQIAIAEQRLRQLCEQAPQESIEDLERRVVELRQAVDHRAEALKQREIAVERLKERIQVLSGGGLDERLAGARRRADELEQECAKYRRDVEALELLLRVLQDAERDAKERYVGPLVRRIRPYLEALFPGSDLEVDEAFRITAVARSGAVEPFERLSEGTREQIAVLTRLAFAELLADQGRPAVVVLDDALVFSDDRRIEQMFEILARAAAKLQIIVLTCREQVFRSLAAHRLRVEQVRTAGAH